MLRRIVRFVETNKLFKRKDKILVAVSGGLDSILLLHFLNLMEVNCAVAHCNFELRGKESDGDSDFVESIASDYGFPFHKINFDTKNIAKESSASIEMAARDLRYNWFSSLCEKYSYDFVAVGHHADDVSETFLINACRGTGIHGLTGIKAKMGNVIRPLLQFSRKELLLYAEKENIRFRNDSTNAETDYVRNKIRHQVLPVLEKINPSIRNTISDNIRNLLEVEKIYNAVIQKKKIEFIHEKNDSFYISVKKLLDFESPSSFLYEFLKDYGFHNREIYNIADSLNSISGKIFYSSSHQVLRDREYLILTEIKECDEKEYLLHEIEDISVPIKMKIKEYLLPENFKFSRNNNIVCLDFDKLTFPLLLRRWKEGDSFRPIGMKGRKKMSDFFIDQKFSLSEKENAWILTSKNKIVWLVGHRIDDSFKITNSTKKIIQFDLL